MRTTSVLALSALILGISIGGVSLASASPAAKAPRTLTLISADTGQGELYIDAGPKGESAGDTIIFSELLYDRARAKKPIGHVEVVCINTSLNAARCNGTLFLAAGKIEAAGAIHFRKTFRIPVVGGTGAYSGTGGELQITELSETRDRYVVRLVA
jgi:allene oxide cyclase